MTMFRILCRLLAVVLACSVLPSGASAEDLVEFLNGAKVRGAVKEIRKDAKEFDFEVRLGNTTISRTYKFDKVHAVTMRGKRYVITKKTQASPTSDGNGTEARRTKTQVLELINTIGRTPPEWFESTPLDYPKTLDLDWPLKPPTKDWNNQQNVGQYKWDIINPNPDRWKSGVRLLHEIMSRHRNEPALLQRDVKAIAEMYFELFQDYPRAAFWLRQAKVQLPEPQGVHLAECYWRLGNRKMASDMLKSRQLPINAIKLLGDMGETDRAAKLASAFGRSYPDRAAEPYLLAGDACRLAGRYDQAIDFYQRVIDGNNSRNETYEKIFTGRAQDSVDAIRLFDKADVTKVVDGTYKGSSTGYNGTLEVEVQVANGKIQDIHVVNHREKQFYAALTDTPSRILKKQSVKGIDATSRATITSQAIVNSTAKALAKGAK